jgi:hypothetical protein
MEETDPTEIENLTVKVGLLVEDLAVRFSISVGSVSSIFNSWVNPERAL